jgi:tellurite resistance protein
MSLFHKTQETPALSAGEAVIAILFLTVTADGNIAPAEEELVIAASNRMQLLRALTIADFNAAVQRIRDAIDASGREAVFAAAVKGAPVDLSATIYALAADIVYAAGGSDPAEVEFLAKIQSSLAIPAELTAKIIEVMQIKNCG